MGPLGVAIAGSAVGAGIGALGSIFSGQSAQDYAERSYKHRYRWTVNDLQKAGLNPMLAYSQGAPVPSSPSIPDAGQAAAHGADVGKNVGLNAMQTKANVALTSQQTATAKAAENESNSKALLNQTQAREIDTLLSGKAELQAANVKELASRVQYQQALIPEITAKIHNLNANSRTADATTAKYMAEIQKIASETHKNYAEIRWGDLNADQKSRLFPHLLSVTSSEAWAKYYSLPEAKYRGKFWGSEKEGEDLGDYRWWKSMGTQMGPFSSAAGIANWLR